ncbi:MAG: ComF family protein [Candidatus Omnitrophica bacterium]|nr:ComF family protein [Candidatus Omnitrophota bacterium]
MVHAKLLRRMRPAEAFANLLYPPACLLCRATLPPPPPQGINHPLCRNCLEAMPRCGPPVCLQCGVGLPGAFDAIARCAVCRNSPRVFEMARAPWQYQGPVQEAVRQFKYHRRWRIGRWLAEGMAITAQRSFPLDEVTAVLPVPLHWLARRLRGRHPSADLASAVARSLEKPYVPQALRRSRWTRTQTRLGWRQRFQNVHQAFIAQGPLVRHRSLLLVDDVLTSGATAEACALALKAAGARRVFVLTAARTPLHR